MKTGKNNFNEEQKSTLRLRLIKRFSLALQHLSALFHTLQVNTKHNSTLDNSSLGCSTQQNIRKIILNWASTRSLSLDNPCQLNQTENILIFQLKSWLLNRICKCTVSDLHMIFTTDTTSTHHLKAG